MTTAVAPLLSRGGLPDALIQRYGADLHIPLRTDRPTLIANFVTTLDGVVSYQMPDAMGGGEISGFFEPDRFVMGILRSLADVVLIGAGTLRAAPKHRWIPEHVSRRHAADFAELRRRLGLASRPLTTVVTTSGDIDLSHPGLADHAIPALVITTDYGARTLARQAARSSLEIVSLGDQPPSATEVMDLLERRGARLVLTEGGPHLIGQLVAVGYLDELFLTIAPQLAGRASDSPRLGLIEGAAFDPASAPWFQLADVRQVDDHLFTRYRNKGTTNGHA